MLDELKTLTKRERLLLLEFVCAFAWADLEVSSEERDYITRLMRGMELEADEVKRVEQWLKLPPRAEEIDPNRVPRAHKELFVEYARRMIEADGHIDPAERENFRLFKALVA
jgi:uncharacterized tellurite resistance protein B-like protein